MPRLPTIGPRTLCTLLAAATLWTPSTSSRAAETQGAETQREGRWMSALGQEHQGDEPVATEGSSLEPRQPVETVEVEYRPGTIGFVARPVEADGPLPGLIVVHEWWGLNDNIRAMTRRLAGEGYLALAVDLYGGRSADDRDGAMALMREAMADREAALSNLRDALDWLDERGQGVGVIGWCFGGAWSLQSAIHFGDRLEAAVVYYGRVVTDGEQLASVAAPLLGIFGEADSSIPLADVRAFATALEGLGKEVTIEVYPGADHAFANPSGTRYDAEAAADAWQKTVDFLGRHLR